jgi:quinol monooxygenase YgiN
MAGATVLLDVTVHIRPEHLDAFIENIRRLTAAARGEPGTLGYAVYPDPDHQGQFRFIEEYRDDTAFREHTGTTVVSDYVAALPGWLTEPATVRVRRTEPLETFTIAPEANR